MISLHLRADQTIFVQRPRAHQTFHEALRTIPTTPVYGSIMFSAFGIDKPRYAKDPEADQRYLEECKDKGVMPHTHQQLRYYERGGLYVPSNAHPLANISVDSPSEIKSAAINGLLIGGKIHQIELGLKEHYGNEAGYRFLVDSFIARMLENDYQISSGELTLSSYHLTGYSEGDYPDWKLKFQTSPRGGEMNLVTGSRLSEIDSANLNGWFSRLREIHEGGQVSILP